MGMSRHNRVQSYVETGFILKLYLSQKMMAEILVEASKMQVRELEYNLSLDCEYCFMSPFSADEPPILVGNSQFLLSQL